MHSSGHHEKKNNMHFNPGIANYSSKVSIEICCRTVQITVYILAILSWWAHNPQNCRTVDWTLHI